MQEIARFMEQGEALSGSVRHIAEFVPNNFIAKPNDVPEALLKSHLATELSKQVQRGGTTLEGFLEGKKPEVIIETLGKMGAGNLDVVRYRLEQVERGAGEYAAAIAHRVLSDPNRPFSSGINGELERVTASLLNERAGQISGYLRAGMSEQAKERRDVTRHMVGNPYERYSLNGRNESLKLPVDSRKPVIIASDIAKILHDLASSGKRRIVAGYSHLEDLFTGTVKGPQERMYLDSVSRPLTYTSEY